MVEISTIKIIAYAVVEESFLDALASGWFHVHGCVWVENEQHNGQQINC